MRGSIVSDGPTDQSERDATGRRAEADTLSQEWLSRLMGEREAPAADGAAVGRSHVTGPAPALARLESQAARFKVKQDASAEWEVCWRLASTLFDENRDLGRAVAAARRALALGGDEEQRVRLGSWFERVGKSGEAAAALAPCVARAQTARDAARMLVRMARLQLRAGEKQLALSNALEAATVWPAFGDALDLAGDLAGALGMVETGTMLLEAADRHDASGNRARAFEARRRAFDFAPDNEQACDALVEALVRTQREEAADGILRLHAQASSAEHARAVQIRRLQRALQSQPPASALAVVLDARLEGERAAEVSPLVDEALSAAGLHDAVVVRMELRASQLQGAERARVFVDLAGLYLGRLASPDRALEAWIEALAADPMCGEARASLRTHAHTMHDPSALAEGLIRAAAGAGTDDIAVECLRELASLAEDRLAEPSLALWAHEQIAERTHDEQALESARGRLLPRVRLQDGALASARKAAQSGSPAEHAEGYRRMAAILRGRPGEIEKYLDVLSMLVQSGRGERRWWVDFERAAVRAGRAALLERVVRLRLDDDPPRADIAHFRTLLITLAMRRGDAEFALADARELEQELPGLRSTAAITWVAATVMGDDDARAKALELLAPNLAPGVRATLLSAAGQILLWRGDHAEAMRLAELAKRADGSEARVIAFRAALAARVDNADLSRALEKSTAIYLPTGQHHEAVVAAFERSGELDLAHAWVRRWVELRPWDLTVLAKLVDSSIATGSADVVVGAIMRLTSAPLPLAQLGPLFSRGLRALVATDPERALSIGRDLLDLYGPTDEPLRDALLHVADVTKNVELEVTVLERAVADATQGSTPMLLRLADHYAAEGKRGLAASALARAASAHAPADEILARWSSAQPTDGDERIDLLRARAGALSDAGRHDEAKPVWQELGSVMWDLAEDPNQAIEAWVSGLHPRDGAAIAEFAQDFARFAGNEVAAAALRGYVQDTQDVRQAACLLVVASALAFSAEQPTSAIDLALEALHRDARRTDALLVIERASERLGSSDAIDRAHAIVAQGAKGRFGRRAAHFRAARTLEQRGQTQLAIVHAIAAFEADPAPGSALALMMRIAEHVAPGEVISTLQRVAETTTEPAARAFWFLQASKLARRDEQSLRQGLDFALRALLAWASVDAVLAIGDAMRKLVQHDAADRDIFELRLQRSLKAVAPKLEGPIGARVALALSIVAGDVLHAGDVAMAWARTGLACSGDIDEYTSLVPHAEVMGAAPDAARDFIDAVITRTQGLGGTTGPALFDFAMTLAKALPDPARADALAVARKEIEARDAGVGDHVDPFADLAEDMSADSDPPKSEEQPGPAAPPPAKGRTRPPPGPGEALVFESEPTTLRGLNPKGSEGKPTPEEPATHPVALASQFEQRGELTEAIRVLEQAEPTEPHARLRHDRMLRRLYAASGRNSMLAVVLGRIVGRTEDATDKVRLLVELAGLLEARSDIEGARARWLQVVEIDPTHREAWSFLENEAAQRDDYERLAELLRRRAVAATSVEEIRAVRVRRAEVLDRRLGKAGQAEEELDQLVAELGQDASVLLARADLAERHGGPIAGAPFVVRAAALVATRTDATNLAIQAAKTYLEAGRIDDARASLSVSGDMNAPRVLEIRETLERASGHSAALADVLDARANLPEGDAELRTAWLLESAELSLDAGLDATALDRAKRAASMGSSDAGLLLHALFLQYRIGGLSPRTEVETMLDRLRAIADRISIEDISLHAFLVAEAIEVLHGPEEAYEYIADRRRVVGLKPLIALGMADRLATRGEPHNALALFDVALEASDLKGVRTRPQVAFLAARAAIRVGGAKLAARYVAIVEQFPEAAAMAQRLRVEMAEVVPATDELRRQLDRVARNSKGTDRALALVQLARLCATRETRASNAEADGYFCEALAAAAAEPLLEEQIHAERDAFRAKLTPSQLPPPVAVDGQMPSVPPPPRAPSFDLASSEPPPLHRTPPPPPLSRRLSSAPPPQRPRAAETPLTQTISSQPPPPERLLSDAPRETSASHAGPAPADAAVERRLFEQLAAGDLDAGDTLASVLSSNAARAHDVVAIRRRQVVLQPDSVRRLELLRDAARADRNPSQAAAVHHVVCVLTGQQPPPAPDLAAQVEDPDRVLAMVFRGVHNEASEVLGHVWKNAPHLFVREPADYGLSGLERVALTAPSPVGRAYAVGARVLGLTRTPLFHRRTAGPINMAVAMLAPLSVIVTGEAGDSLQLTYRLASMLAGTCPANGMLFGLPPAGVRQLLIALLAAFGPPEASKGHESENAVLAGELWRALPGSTQRRMQQIFGAPEPVSYDDAWARALQSSRRAGLFVVGDLVTALNDVLDDPGMRDAVDIDAPNAFRELVKNSVSAADLVRFATSAEYAEARWRDDAGRNSGAFRSF